MESLSSFKYKPRCSIFQSDFEVEAEDVPCPSSSTSGKNIFNNNSGEVKSHRKSSASIKSEFKRSSCKISNTVNKFADESCNNDLDDTSSFQDDVSEFKLEILKGIFKDTVSDQMLMDVVGDTNSLDHAVSVLLDSQMAPGKELCSKDEEWKKTGTNGSLSSPCKLSKGRKRLSSDEASPFKQSRSKKPSKSRKLTKQKEVLSTADKSTGNSATISSVDTICGQDDFNKLKELFPDCEEEELLDVLESNNYCLDDAIASMKAFSSPSKKEFEKMGKQVKQKRVDLIVLDDHDNNLSDVHGKTVIVSDDEDQGSDFSDEDVLGMSSEEKAEVLSLLDSSEMEEIALVRGFSMSRVKKICSLRPFHNWDDLVRKMRKTKGLSEELLSECASFVNERDRMEELMNECEIISKDIQGLFDVETSTNEDCSEKDAVKSAFITKERYISTEPSTVAPEFKLKPYQLTGLNWLIAIHRKKLNGILADEMGLGKTVQAIVFLAHLIERRERGPHLIIVPSSTRDNWRRELEQWCPSVKYLYYSGSQDCRRDLRNEVLCESEFDFQVVLTTYNMAMSTSADLSFLRKLHFHYAVFDEAHMLKNMKSQRFQSLLRIKPERMLLLTGTPIQNNLLELMSLLIFVMPKMFAERHQGIKLLFGETKKQKEETSFQKEKVAQAKRIMRPFVMRRLKKDVLGELPTKHSHLIECELPVQQRSIYDEIFVSCCKIMESGSVEGSVGMSLMMKLRKAANHSLLHRTFYHNDKLSEMARVYCKDPSHRDSDANLVFEDMQVMSDFELSRLCLSEKNLKDFVLPNEMILECGKFIYLDTVLTRMKKKGDRVLLFSQFTMMLDIVEVYLQTRSYSYLRLDGSTSVAERQALIDRFNAENDIFIFLLSTKAGGLGINLTSANVVILYDSDYNPHNDKQAEDRCHRLGQTREVNVYRLICKDTIEETILKCANDKIRLHDDISGNKITEADNVQTLLQAVFKRH